MSGVEPLKRSSSLEWLPPDMSELKVVLLGNSWSERCSVGNLILGETVFNTDRKPDCLMVKRQMKEKTIVLINTPDLLHPTITSDRLKELVQCCVSLCDPGPHVFLLILQPEDFTEEQKEKLCRVLELFGDQPFDHSLVLISQPRDKRKYMGQPPLKDMIQECKYRYLNLKDLDHPELLTRLGQIVKENRREHFSCEVTRSLTASETKSEESRWSLTGVFKTGGQYVLGAVGFGSGRNQSTDASGIRIVLLGKSQDKQRKLINFICNTQSFSRTSKQHGQWRGKPVTVVKTPDIFSLSVQTIIEEVKKCVRVCSPGPNVLLLLVNPSNFTVENRQTLKFILTLFGLNAFEHSMVIMTHKMEEMNPSVDELLKDCGGRDYSMVKEDHTLLMEMMEKTVCENRGTFLTFSEDSIRPEGEDFRPALNLVLCGRRGAVKTSVAEAILGPTAFGSVSTSSECVKHQGEICGRWVSLVELPALYGQPEEKVMEKSLRCVSLCDPEGVHVFILVLPVGHLTDEDKAELETIQKTLGSGVNDFIMILLATESDPKAAPVVNFVREDKDIQKLLQSCGGRNHVLNVNDKQQIPELIDSLDTMRQRPYKDKPWSYTAETFAQAQIQKIIQQKQKITNLLRRPSLVSCEDEESPECLRIVLIGKTGSGKSSSGNTILGREIFEADFRQTSVTKCCQKVRSDVDGRQVAVVDTPGLFDTTLSREQINTEMVKCISHLAPGPHVFLLVVRLGRFTQEEKDTLKLIKEAFGKNAEKYTIILLTGGDDLEDKKTSIEDFIKNKCDESFKTLIADCGGRYHVFNNKEKQIHTQVSELISKIERMVKENQGSCFTNEMLQEAEAAIKKKMERIMREKEEEMKREREEIQRKHQEEMDDMKRKMEEQRDKTEKERKLKEQQLEEMKENILRENQERQKEQDMRTNEEKKKKEEEETERHEWKKRVEDLEQRIKSESESKKEEMKRDREELKRQHDEEMGEMKRKVEQQRDKAEKERLLKEQELQQMKENILSEQQERKREQEMREEEKMKKKQEEEVERKTWNEEIKAMEQKIKSESESKENIDRKLAESREEMRKEREKWERKQDAWWENRSQEDEKRRKEEQDKIRRLQEEYDHEIESYKKQKKEEDRIRKEQEEKEKKETEEKHNKAMEQRIKSEAEYKERTERKLEEMIKEQENWERQQSQWWEQRSQDQKRLHEEQQKIKSLQEEYEREKENYKKQREEDRIRSEQEEKKKKDMEEKYETNIENLKKSYEEEARKKAEEFNEFRDKYTKKLAEQEEENKKKKKEMEWEHQRKEEEHKLKEAEIEEKYQKQVEEHRRKEEEKEIEYQKTVEEQKKEKEKMEKEHQRTVEEYKKDKEEMEKNHQKKEEEHKKKKEEMEKEHQAKEEENKMKEVEKEKEYQKTVEEHRKEKEEMEKEYQKKEDEHKKKMEEMEKEHQTKVEEHKKKKEEMEKEHQQKEDEHKKKKEEMEKEHQKKEENFKKQITKKDEQYDLLKAAFIMNQNQREKQKEKHKRELCDLVKGVTNNSDWGNKIKQLLNKQEEEMEKATSEEEKKSLEQKHKEQIHLMFGEIVKEVNKSWCVIL